MDKNWTMSQAIYLSYRQSIHYRKLYTDATANLFACTNKRTNVHSKKVKKDTKNRRVDSMSQRVGEDTTASITID